MTAARMLRALVLVLCVMSALPRVVLADNQMGYRLLSARDAQGLPSNHGALGMDVESSQQISDEGMTFDLIRVKQVRSGSAGAQAGFARGDQIIAVDGQVFPSVRAFAAYVGSIVPGRQVTIDFIPAGRGPGDAERVPVVVGAAGQSGRAPAGQDQPSGGMSMRTKIGIGAAALIGCYALGCFSSRH